MYCRLTPTNMTMSLDELRVPLEGLTLSKSCSFSLSPESLSPGSGLLAKDSSLSGNSLLLGQDSMSSGNSLLLGQDSVSSGNSLYMDQEKSNPSYSESQSSTPSKHSGTNSGYLNDGTDIEGSTCDHRRRNSVETVDTSLTVELNYSFLDKYSKLIDLERVPWCEQEVLNVLREGRTKEYSGHITVEIMQRLCFLIQRPLHRLARETLRLSQQFCRCGREEVTTAMRIVLSQALSDSCLQACHKAVALYAMSGDSFRESKSARCGLRFSVGKFHRWMLDAGLAPCVHEHSAIYMTACVENLLEEIVILALGNQQLGDVPWRIDNLEYGVASNADLWGLLQPYEHLITGRTATGALTLPSCLHLDPANANDPLKVKGRQQERECPSSTPVPKNLEQSLLATCVGSVSELGELVGKSMPFWQTQTSNVLRTGRPSHVTWSTEALHTLYYFMRCPQLEHVDDPSVLPPSLHLWNERPYSIQPPLVDWIRVSTSHTEYRRGWVVDHDDVHQAARLLLPAVDCPIRNFSPNESLCTSRLLDAPGCAEKFRRDLGFQMLRSGRSDILQHALALLGPGGVNAQNEQGLTPLMVACIHGDEGMVQLLLDAGARCDMAVPTDLQRYPCVLMQTRHWTALTFATVKGHLGIVQLLLERGASVEGSISSGEDNFSETPLQLASAAGHYDLSQLLLSKGADPYLTTLHKNGVSFTYSRGGYSAFALAAAHGHRNVLRKLLMHPINSGSDLLSLEEILAEGTTDTLKNRINRSMSQEMLGKQEITEETIIEQENDYVTIEEVVYEDNRLHNQKNLVCPFHKLTKGQARCLQESLYHAAENGFLDIALELRNMGVPWSLHTWGQCLSAAYNMRRKAIVQCLLRDFAGCRQEVYSKEFIDEILPLMIEVLKHSKVEQTNRQLSEILSSLFGEEPIPTIQELKMAASARIDSRYVNNPELSDIQFKVGGKIFYAHKIILVNASNRFRAMLSTRFTEGKQNLVEINDVQYHIFQYIMKYLYNGTAEKMKVSSQDIMELMAASNFFMLDGLQRHCEKLCSNKITHDNCVAIYKHAKLFTATELMRYCEGYILQHLPELVTGNDDFKRMLRNLKPKGPNLAQGLLTTLASRMQVVMELQKKPLPPQPLTPR